MELENMKKHTCLKCEIAGLQGLFAALVAFGWKSDALPFAVTFALLVRLIAVTTDLIGLPPLLKTSGNMLSGINHKKQPPPTQTPAS
jgi:hypothetical protein